MQDPGTLEARYGRYDLLKEVPRFVLGKDGALGDVVEEVLAIGGSFHDDHKTIRTFQILDNTDNAGQMSSLLQ